MKYTLIQFVVHSGGESLCTSPVPHRTDSKDAAVMPMEDSHAMNMAQSSSPTLRFRITATDMRRPMAVAGRD